MELLLTLAMKFWMWTVLIALIIIGFIVNLFDKKEPKLYTRGNGKVGSDASDLVNWMEFPKITSPTPIYFRGELLISKSDWPKVQCILRPSKHRSRQLDILQPSK